MNKKTFIKLHSSGYLELLGTTTAKTDEMDKMERTVERTIKRAGGIGKLAASATSALRHSEVYGSEVEIEVDRHGLIRLITRRKGSDYIHVVFYRGRR